MSTTIAAMDLLPRSGLDRIVAFCLDAGKPQVLAVSGLMIAGIAVADWEVGLDISLGILYILPMVLAAIVLTPRSIIDFATLNWPLSML